MCTPDYVCVCKLGHIDVHLYCRTHLRQTERPFVVRRSRLFVPPRVTLSLCGPVT